KTHDGAVHESLDLERCPRMTRIVGTHHRGEEDGPFELRRVDLDQDPACLTRSDRLVEIGVEAVAGRGDLLQYQRGAALVPDGKGVRDAFAEDDRSEVETRSVHVNGRFVLPARGGVDRTEREKGDDRSNTAQCVHRCLPRYPSAAGTLISP